MFNSIYNYSAPPQRITPQIRNMMIEYSIENLEDSPCKNCLVRPTCSELCDELFEVYNLKGITSCKIEGAHMTLNYIFPRNVY